MQGRNDSPPRRERILEWQAQQDFPICPTPDEPGTCNVYSELRFPDRIYDNIGDFWEEQAEAVSDQWPLTADYSSPVRH